MLAYDLERGDWFHVKQTGIIDPEMYDFRCVQLKLIFVPSIVALLWTEPCLPAVDEKVIYLVLHCMKIVVDLEPEKRFIQTYLMNCKAVITDGLYDVNYYLR
ncbi:hypothetical protein Droror1_Dr00014442 [Drosera rotundifolia]